MIRFPCGRGDTGETPLLRLAGSAHRSFSAGFPETHIMWRRRIAPALARDFTVLRRPPRYAGALSADRGRSRHYAKRPCPRPGDRHG